MEAKANKCCECDRPAVAYFPVFEPEIPSFPYCQKHLDKVKNELLNKLEKEGRLN